MHFTLSKPTLRRVRKTQAERIIEKFGGARRLSRILTEVGVDRAPSTIYRWLYEKPRGRGGLIPTSAWSDILKAARADGILITSEDMDPRDIYK